MKSSFDCMMPAVTASCVTKIALWSTLAMTLASSFAAWSCATKAQYSAPWNVRPSTSSDEPTM